MHCSENHTFALIKSYKNIHSFLSLAWIDSTWTHAFVSSRHTDFPVASWLDLWLRLIIFLLEFAVFIENPYLLPVYLLESDLKPAEL